MYTAWWNSQEWSKSLDRALKVPRFFIETGSEEPFKEDNDIMEHEKVVKKDFFLDTMKMAQYAFSVNWAGAKSLLEKAGTVRGLASLVEIKLLDLEIEELEILSKKCSNLALENFFKKRKMNLSNDSLADITIAAEKLLNM